MDMRQLVAIGKEMGYEGESLRQFVAGEQEKQAKEMESLNALEREKLAYEREERRLAREDAKEQAEREKERAESEKAEREARHERELNAELEREKIKLQMSQLEIERLKIANDNGSKSGSNAGSTQGSDEEDENADSGCHAPKKGPKLPHFEEKSDDMDAYLQRFERYAAIHKWPESDWSVYLGALLKGRALEVYTRLASADANVYTKLKEALLRNYQLNAEGFKRKFYTSRPESRETAAQFVCRLDNYFDRWIQLSKTEREYDDLKSLLIREQFLSVCPKELAMFLRERASSDLNEFVELADQYLDAHIPWMNRNRTQNDQSLEPRKDHDGAATSGVKSALKGKNTRVCYQCNRPGHIAKFCRNSQQGAEMIQRPPQLV